MKFEGCRTASFGVVDSRTDDHVSGPSPMYMASTGLLHR